ncbi:MAG TPA: hypothetical protein PKY87_11690, partial [Terricaulis sp.]|nr:hypothetical protein [Terricaulis sp.]
LPGRAGAQIRRDAGGAGATDARLEEAALDYLTPGTRARYIATVPLLARRAASGSTERANAAMLIGDQRDFELLARAMLGAPESNALQFVLTGFGLNLADEFTPQMSRGAAALLMASRRDDYPLTLETEINSTVAGILPMSDFRAAAIAGAGAGDAGAYANSSAAFREALSPDEATAFANLLAQIGEIADATSVGAAVSLLSHAQTTADLPRLRLLAQSAGDRAAAAAKRLPRDGELLKAARGELTVTRDLAGALAAAVLALLGLIAMLGWIAYRFGQRLWARWNEDEHYVAAGGDLVDISSSTWRPL